MTYDCRRNRGACTRRGDGPAVLRRLDAGFATLGNAQFLPGCSVLLADDEPGVRHLSDLPRSRRLAFLSDLDRLGEAVEESCRRMDGAFRHVDLEIVGDGGRFLHAHVWPRFAWEPAELLDRPVWFYPSDRWSDRRFRLGPQHDALRRAIGSELDRSRPPEDDGPPAGGGSAGPLLGGVESILIEVFTAAGRASGAAGSVPDGAGPEASPEPPWKQTRPFAPTPAPSRAAGRSLPVDCCGFPGGAGPVRPEPRRTGTADGAEGRCGSLTVHHQAGRSSAPPSGPASLFCSIEP